MIDRKSQVSVKPKAKKKEDGEGGGVGCGWMPRNSVLAFYYGQQPRPRLRF